MSSPSLISIPYYQHPNHQEYVIDISPLTARFLPYSHETVRLQGDPQLQSLHHHGLKGHDSALAYLSQLSEQQSPLTYDHSEKLKELAQKIESFKATHFYRLGFMLAGGCAFVAGFSGFIPTPWGSALFGAAFGGFANGSSYLISTSAIKYVSACQNQQQNTIQRIKAVYHDLAIHLLQAHIALQLHDDHDGQELSYAPTSSFLHSSESLKELSLKLRENISLINRQFSIYSINQEDRQDILQPLVETIDHILDHTYLRNYFLRNEAITLKNHYLLLREQTL